MNKLKLVNTKIFLVVLISLLIFIQGIFLLPALDRDESRFAASTKNMIESKDFIDIRLENVPRYKKPIGIYWAQALSTIALGKTPYNEIWTYRIPSLLGIILSIILIFFVTKKLFREKTAFLSIIFLLCSLLLISEIHQAKTDGFLYLYINICNFISLIKIDQFNQKKKDKDKLLTLLFWMSLGIGTIIKGPIILIFVGLPLLTYALITKNFLLIKSFHSFGGYSIFFLITLPWFIIITIQSDGLFWYESVINDLLRKVSKGQESHGFPPGYYLILLFIFFWPGSSFLFSWAIDIYKNRKTIFVLDHKVLFLFCWLFPSFILYELIPTKLPHYVLPCYTPLGILVSIFLLKKQKSSNFFNFKTFLSTLIFPLTYISLFLISIYKYSSLTSEVYVAVVFLLLILLMLLLQIRRKNLKSFVVAAVIFQVTVYFSILHILNPHLNMFWISKNIETIINEEKNIENVYHSGFNEPSLVFYVGHQAMRISPELMVEKYNNNAKNIFVLTQKNMSKFLQLNDDREINMIRSFTGFNYSQGRYMKFFIFKN